MESTLIEDDLYQLQVNAEENEFNIFTVAAPKNNASEATLALMLDDEEKTQFVDLSCMKYNDNENGTFSTILQSRGDTPLPSYVLGFNDGKGAGRVRKLEIAPDAVPMQFTSDGIRVRKDNAYDNNWTDDNSVVVNLAELPNKADKNHVHDKSEQLYLYTIDLSDSTYNQDTYYPAVGEPIPNNGFSRIKVSVQLNSGTVPTWSLHDGGFTCNLDLLVSACHWGGNPGNTIALDSSYMFATSNPCGYGQMHNSSRPVLWLRGGGKYFVWSDYAFNFDVKTSEYTAYENTIAPMTTYPGIYFNKSTITANLNGNADTATIASSAIESHTSSFYVRNNGSDNIEGGELRLRNMDESDWVIDSYNNTLRIFDNKTTNMQLTCNKDNPSNSYFAGKSNSANYSKYIAGWDDNRNVNTVPNDYNSRFEVKGLKTNEAIGYPDNSAFSTVMGLRAWHDHTGGDTHEIAFTGNGQVFQRHGAVDAWTSWNRFYTSENLTYGTSELTPGSSSLPTGNFYFQYE